MFKARIVALMERTEESEAKLATMLDDYRLLVAERAERQDVICSEACRSPQKGGNEALVTQRA